MTRRAGVTRRTGQFEKVKTMDVVARSEKTKQSPGFGRLEIAASAFGLLAMTTPQISLDGYYSAFISSDWYEKGR
jgi:hypothetical protein